MTDMSEIRCTKESPWNGYREPDQVVVHPDADEVGDQEDGWPGGDIVTYQCPYCGHRWRVELPQ